MSILGIRVSTAVSCGRGHFMRCLSIREFIKSKVIWFIDEKNKSLESQIPNKDKIFYENGIDKYEYLEKAIYNKFIHYVLIDNYSLKDKDIKTISNNIPIAIILDQDSNIFANIIICPQPQDFSRVKGVKYLCGPKYAPINTNFQYKKNSINYSNLLISFGSYDSKGLTLNAIQAVNKLVLNKNYKLEVIILLGRDSPILNEVKKLIKSLDYFNLIIETNNMENIYNSCSIAIGAPGLSQLERMYYGLSSIIISQNNLHKSLIKKWVKLNVAIESENSIVSIEKNLKILLDNKSLCCDIIKKGTCLVDGKGSKKIAYELDKLVGLI